MGRGQLRNSRLGIALSWLWRETGTQRLSRREEGQYLNYITTEIDSNKSSDIQDECDGHLEEAPASKKT